MRNRTLKQSFDNAWTGIVESIQSERNLRIHAVAICAVVTAGAVLSIDSLRWALLFVACGTVVVAELLNTAIERLVDMVTDKWCEEARQVKDMAAGAVLVAAFFALLIGFGVFFEPVCNLLFPG